MSNNEKTFEQGVVVGMLLNKGVGKGPNTYNLKDQLFKYVLENGKIIGTCKFGNNRVKAYIGLVHYSDPNAKLFWTLSYGSNGIRNNYMDNDPYTKDGIHDRTDPHPIVLSIAPLIMNDEGVIEYVANIFFSEDDEPLFGSIILQYTNTYYSTAYITNSPNTTSSGIKARACWPNYVYSGLEEAMEAVEYMGDIEAYIYADTYTSTGTTNIRTKIKYKDSSGADVSGSGNFNIVLKKSATKSTWRKTTGQTSDGSTVTIDDTTKPPIITTYDPSDYNISLSVYYDIMPPPVMVADNVTDKDIANAVANAYNVLYKNAEGPAAAKLLGAEASSLLTPQQGST